MRTTLDEEQTSYHRLQLENSHEKKRAPAPKLTRARADEPPTRPEQGASSILLEPAGRVQLASPQTRGREAERAHQEDVQVSCSVAPETAADTMATGNSALESIEDHQQQQQQQQNANARQTQQQQQLAKAAQYQRPARYLMSCNERPAASAGQTSYPSYPPKIYPNNTLVADLSRCHDNLLPKVARATSRTLKLVKSCSPTNRASDLSADKTVGEHESKSTDESKKLKFVRAKRKYKFSMPESILRLSSSLGPEDYNRALSVLTSDIRFQLHILLFARLQTIWTLFSTVLCILIPVLFAAATAAATPETSVILGSCAIWLGLQAAGALVTGQCRKKLDHMLEKSVAQANSYFLDHKLMLGVINAGGLLTKSRLVIPMVYFDTFECIEQIESIVSVDPNQPVDADGERDKLALRGQLAPDYPQFGPAKQAANLNQKAFAQSQLAKKIILRYSQRWISHFDKRRLMFTDDKLRPRHLSTGKCLCQFVEEHLRRDQQQQIEQDLEELSVAGEGAACCRQETPVQQLLVDRLESGNRANDSTTRLSARTECQSLEPNNRQTTTAAATVINIPSYINDFNEQCVDLAAVPTLSHLVSMRDRPQAGDQSTAQNRLLASANEGSDSLASSNYSSKLIDSFASHLQQERLDSNSSPGTELSLELGDGDNSLFATSRNDELIKRLKILLEIRSNEFPKSSGLVIETSHQQQQHHHHSQNGSSPRLASRELTNGDSGDASSPGRQTSHCDGASANSGNSHGSSISQIGKKFFCQTDGLFFLGVKKGQQSGFYAKQQQQLLETC